MTCSDIALICNLVGIFIRNTIPGLETVGDHVLRAVWGPPLFPQIGSERGLFLWWCEFLVLRRSSKELV